MVRGHPPQHTHTPWTILNRMALITSDCDATRTHEHRMALIISECAPAEAKEAQLGFWERSGQPRPTAAIPMDNPYRSCKLTRVLRAAPPLHKGTPVGTAIRTVFAAPSNPQILPRPRLPTRHSESEPPRAQPARPPFGVRAPRAAAGSPPPLRGFLCRRERRQAREARRAPATGGRGKKPRSSWSAPTQEGPLPFPVSCSRFLSPAPVSCFLFSFPVPSGAPLWLIGPDAPGWKADAAPSPINRCCGQGGGGGTQRVVRQRKPADKYAPKPAAAAAGAGTSVAGVSPEPELEPEPQPQPELKPAGLSELPEPEPEGAPLPGIVEQP